LYFSVRDRNGLFFLRRRPRSIDNSDMVEHEDWCINTYEVRNAARLLCLRDGDRGNEQCPKQEQETHFSIPRKTDLRESARSQNCTPAVLNGVTRRFTW
jgi:hypothetical protein